MNTLHLKSLLWAGLFTSALTLSACGGDSSDSGSGSGSSASNGKAAFELYTQAANNANNAKSISFDVTAGTSFGENVPVELLQWLKITGGAISAKGNVALKKNLEGKYQAALKGTDLNLLGEIVVPSSKAPAPAIYLDDSQPTHTLYWSDGVADYVTPPPPAINIAKALSLVKFFPPLSLEEVDVEQSKLVTEGNVKTLTLFVPPEVLAGYYGKLLTNVEALYTAYPKLFEGDTDDRDASSSEGGSGSESGSSDGNSPVPESTSTVPFAQYLQIAKVIKPLASGKIIATVDDNGNLTQVNYELSVLFFEPTIKVSFDHIRTGNVEVSAPPQAWESAESKDYPEFMKKLYAVSSSAP